MTRAKLIFEDGMVAYKDIDTSLEYSEVSTFLGGRATFLGKINDDDVIVIKHGATGPLNPYLFPNLERFSGRALIFRTDKDGNPIDL